MVQSRPGRGAGGQHTVGLFVLQCVHPLVAEAAIDPGLTRDVYVSLGEQLPDGRWTVKAWVKPFVDWIWGGCFLMALGGFVALSDRRYRAARSREPARQNGLGSQA
jgi:cytochrome c biogenesis factor